MVCFNCGKPGHFERDCPRGDGRYNKKDKKEPCNDGCTPAKVLHPNRPQLSKKLTKLKKKIGKLDSADTLTLLLDVIKGDPDKIGRLGLLNIRNVAQREEAKLRNGRTKGEMNREDNRKSSNYNNRPSSSCASSSSFSYRKNLPSTSTRAASPSSSSSSSSSSSAYVTVQPPPGYIPRVVSDTCLSANHTAFIFEGDLIQAQQVFWFDTEKVQLKNGYQPSVDFSIVAKGGDIAFRAIVLMDPAIVQKWHTKLTGNSEEKNALLGLPLEFVRQLLDHFFAGKEIWGAGSIADWKSLGYGQNDHPFIVRDLQDFYKDKEHRPYSLSKLATHFLGRNPQEFTHSSLRDARLTLILWKKMMHIKEAEAKEGYYCTRFKCSAFEGERRKEQEELRKEKIKAYSLGQKYFKPSPWADNDEQGLTCNCNIRHRGGLSDLGVVRTTKDWHFYEK